jgi:hypothetical protein
VSEVLSEEDFVFFVFEASGEQVQVSVFHQEAFRQIERKYLMLGSVAKVL